MPVELPRSRSARPGRGAAPGLRRPALLAVACAALLTPACAAVTAPPRFTAVSPADADAPEGAVPPAAALLTGEGELAEGADAPAAPAAASPDPHAGHEGHASPAPMPAAVDSCPMHPQVSEPQPGSCPICGAALVETHAPPPEAGR